MQKIGDITPTANAEGEYREGSAQAGVGPTLIKAAWLNTVQRELLNVVSGAGLTINPADDSQVLKAIQAIQTAASTWAKLTGKPTTVSGFGITDAFTKAETSTAIQQAVAALVASSPAALDTLKELADALGNDPNFATTMINELAGKAAKATSIAGYGITDAYTKAQIDALLSAVDPWAAQPIGVPIPVLTNIAGVTTPPTNKSYRYISLTAADAYNIGVLTGEVVSGAAPLVVASAVVNLAGSPLDGKTVSLINTERRVIRAGQSGLLEVDQFQSHRMAAISSSFVNGGSLNVAAGSAYAGGVSVNATTGGPVTDTVNGAPRFGDETRAKSIGATYFMRIK